MTEILGLYPDFFDFPGFAKLGLRFGLNLAFTAMIVLGVYVRRYGKKRVHLHLFHVQRHHLRALLLTAQSAD